MRRTAWGLSAGLLLAVAGCSGATPAAQLDSGQASTAESLTSADPTGDPNSGPASGTVPGAALAGRVRAAMAAAGSARFALQSSTTSGQDATGVINVKGAAVSVRFDFTDGTDKLRVISLPGVLYADVGTAVDGRHWLKVTAEGTDPLSSAMAPLLSYMTNSADVSAQTDSWGAAGTFAAHDPAPIDGVTATEYDATIPLAAVRAGLPDQFRDIMQKDITGDSRVRLWLDAQDRPVRVVTSGSYDHQADMVTVTYSAWGRAPAVQPPPAADIITARS